MTRSRTVGIVTQYPHGLFFNTVLLGAQAVARQYSANLLVLQGTPDSIAESQIARNKVDAWMVLSQSDGIERLLAQGKPAVTIGAVAPGGRCPAIVPDNRGGIEAAVQHLVEHGHQQIAFVGWTANDDIRERYAGYQAALAQHGRPLNPKQVVITNGPLVDEGQRAARQLIANGLPCTAVVVGTDFNAIGMMQELQQAGYRIPEDVAVVGFDDVPQAQSANPPLSTIRQSFDALGARGLRLLADMLDGQAHGASVVHTPVLFVQRRSCGCGAALATDTSGVADHYRDSQWRDQLARALVNVLMHPVGLDPALAPAAVWPEVTPLIAVLENALASEAALDLAGLQAVWNSDLALRANVESLHEAVNLFEQVALTRAEAAGSSALKRARGLIERMRLEVMRGYRRYQEGRIDYLERVVTNTHRISLLLLDETNPQTQQLNWLESTQIVWGCLGLWREPADGAARDLVIAQSYSEIEGAAAPSGRRYPVADFPPLELLHTPNELTTSLLVPLRTSNKEWGFLALSGTIVPSETQFAENATDNLVMWAAQLAAMLERRELAASLRQSYENERALASTVRELGAPIIPLISGVLLIPLVGALDSARAQQVISAVLDGVSQHQAAVVLLDLTAVPIVDTQVANTLIQSAQAATLLGAQVILVGIRPEIAQSIVSLGLSLQQIVTRPTLEVALNGLIARRNSAKA